MPEHAENPRRSRSPLSRIPLLCVLSLIAMLPWPAAGTALLRSQFDDWSEAIFMLGGVTAIPAMIVAVFGAPDSVYVAIMVIVWVAAWIAPPFIWLRRTPRLGRVLVVLGSQSAFSLVQAMMGVMLVIGKSV